MPFYFYVWTPEIIDHLKQHGVSPAEFEEIVGDPAYEEISRSTGNPLAFGITSGGRCLCCVFKRLDEDTIEPVTAYDVGE